ncbi:MAG TPA: antibiotic biosynthesis monooxygenase [Streptosporangiaceae bacterium]|nr:antibiotic biosynthesis monooxygenase [Streptosporangiaceae bacterium]
MSVSVLVAFAGALAAAVGTGMLVGRFIRAPRSDLAAWSAVLFMLAVALGAQTMGFAVGFSSATFRVTQVAGLLLAPLWLAWGLVELAGRTGPARFASRLVTAALTVVPGVILILDPLNSAPAFGKAWPGEKHYMVLPTTALTAIHVIAVAVALLMMSIAATRTRRDQDWWEVFVPAAAAGAAVLLTVSLGFSLPNAGYPLLTAAAAGMVWFAASRSERVRLDQLRAGGHPTDEPRSRPGRRRRGRAPLDSGAPPGLADDPTTGPLVALASDGFPVSREFDPPIAGSGASAASLVPPPPPPPPPSPMAPPAPPGPAVMSQLFGLIAIYTLLDGRGEEFDRLAERTVEAVRAQEPDTLLFVVHTVPKAPMQRIFYEVYRDRMAYRDHRRKPHVEDFFARHRPYVLATNVIELDLRYAKVSALPSLGATFSRDGLSRDGGGVAERG